MSQFVVNNWIVNLSVTTGEMPDSLKKPTADFQQFTNIWPISNLKFVSKFVGKSVAVQLTEHVITNHLGETFQSAYTEFHSTETAPLRVQKTSCVLLIKICWSYCCLDLSAAFDTVDHAILISRLSNR